MPGLMQLGKNIAISFVYLKIRDPFQRNYAYQYPYPLDVEAMREASSTIYLVLMTLLVFVRQRLKWKIKFERLKKLNLLKKDEFMVFRFVGNGFLYNMVRILGWNSA